MGQVTAEQIANLGRRLEALRRVFGVQLIDDGDQPVGDLGIRFADGSRRFRADALQHRDRAAGTKRRAPGAHRIEDAPQAEEVGALVERLSLACSGDM